MVRTTNPRARRLLLARIFGSALLLSLLASFVTGVGAGVASAACRSYVPAVTNDDHFGYSTNVYTVPSTSTCQDINISNISMQGRPDISCGTFWVQMYPSSGGYINTSKKSVCSIPPSGPLYVLASSVKNGTRYRVMYDYMNGFVGRGYSFRVTD